MKVIFLDIDGVLNCEKTPNPRKFPYVVDKKLLARFQKLLVQLKAHQEAVTLFEAYAKGGDNADLKKWAATTLPHLKVHLTMAQKLK